MGERRGRRVMLAAWVTTLMAAMAAALLSGVPPSAHAAGPDGSAVPATTRVMVVGDSISHASVGDYSWRYFAWKHWESVGAQVDLVGPQRDPYVAPQSRWPAVYADANFDQDHAATWGDRLSIPRHDRAQLLLAHRPDIVVLQLGLNDLLWGLASPEQAAELARQWVRSARAQAPDTNFVLVEIPWTDNPAAMSFNRYLHDVEGELDVVGSRVRVARATSGYVMGRADGRGDTYEKFHPNARGDVKIAAAVTDAVASLGVGAVYPRPLRFPAEGPRVAPALKSTSTEAAARWTWSVPPGATSYDVWLRLPGQHWARAARSSQRNSYTLSGLRQCAPHRVRVLARKGWTLADADMTSNVVTTRVGPTVEGRAVLRAVRPRSRAVKVSWSKVSGACSYLLRATYRSPGSAKVTRLLKPTGASAVVRRIPKGSKVRIQVRGIGARNSTAWSRVRVVTTRS